ncbi:hypothetical protein ZTR_05281 [Talaromyces verruculosus]|nr:hypothetical protein ZTR_05281 [Talaromyces verruculosus]
MFVVRLLPREKVAQPPLATESPNLPNTGSSDRPPSNTAGILPVATTLEDGITQQTSEGTRFLQQELESNAMTSPDRSTVLRRAIDFVSQISNSAHLASATGTFKSYTRDSDAEPHKFTPELLYIMTLNLDAEPGAMKRSFWPDHVSFETLENMCLSIMEEKEHRQTLVCYRICVYMKVVTLISRLPRRDRSNPVRHHLEQSKNQYEDEIRRALSELDFLAPPSLPFLQALLSGAIFMQNQGDMSRSWTLTAFAARTLVSLNYHTIDKRAPSDGELPDVYGAIYICYYLDKILSVLLLRPPSLPRLRVKPADLVHLEPRLPLSACVKVMVCFGQIQEGILDIFFNHSVTNEQVIAANTLVQEIYHVRAVMDEPQCQTLAQETNFEWAAIEFGYCTLLSSVLQLQQRVVQSPSARQEGVRAARQALVQLTKLQDEIAIDKNFMDEYPYFLTWQVFLHPYGVVCMISDHIA